MSGARPVGARYFGRGGELVGLGGLCCAAAEVSAIDDGFAAAGYDFVSVDSCWAERERDPQGHVIANRTRFPK